MALGENRAVNPGITDSTTMVSAKGSWVTANSDLTVAHVTADFQNPQSVDDSSVHWVQVGRAASSLLLRMRYATTVTSIGTAPVVRVYGAWTPNGDAARDIASGFSVTPTDANYAYFMRLDNADNDDAVGGLTFTLDHTHDIDDGTTSYSDPPTLTPLDLMGAEWVAVLVQTAAATIGGSGSIQCDILAI